ncbi:RagB/SusD family nutrient uptake outer membrane protein [Pedobacter sp. GR22-6]|uniref:RagB/SusD family nutrient uptake outer membrane protein n=1 Tax=Pedobacter sp. GR22-6 TaxID=3127957 RepID=UPI00307FBA42
MKKISLIVLTLFGIMSTISCKKYLTIVPKTQMPQDVLFSTEGGFKDALTGVYIQMKDNSSYGGALTQTTIEQLSSSWDVTSNATDQRLGLFNYTDAGVQSSFEAIYAQQYKIISSVNAILGQIDSKKDVFSTPGLYELVKSEALSIRAYCHLDILRLFGPIPSDPSNGNTLPYVRVLSTSPNARIPFDEFQTLLLKDLTDAEALVKDIDPITKYTLAQLRAPGISSGFNPTDTYFAYRYLRMNYYAIKALQARAYLWFNMTDKAYEAAKLVIEAKNENGTTKFRFGTSADLTIKDFVLSSEHVFGLYDFDMFNKYTSRYSTGVLKKGSAATTITAQLYGTTGTDIRESGLWELVTLANASKVYVIKKYQAIDSKLVTASTDFKQIPMLRLSEMYLIAAETAPFTEGLNYFKSFRTARNIGQLVLPANAAALKTEIIKEYRKEFYAEGQGFFAYKRSNIAKASFLFAPSAATINYLVPLPKTEAI